MYEMLGMIYGSCYIHIEFAACFECAIKVTEALLTDQVVFF